MKQDIDVVMQRTYRYYYADGIVELGVGGLFLAVSLLLLLWRNAEVGSPVNIGLALGLPVVVIGGGFLLQRAVRALKNRVTYPRTGFLSYNERDQNLGRWIVPLGALLFVILYMFPLAQFLQMSAMEGWILFLVFGYLGYRLALPRFYLLGILAVLIGLSASIFDLGDLAGSIILFAGSGMILILSGGIVLVRYLLANPVQEQVEL